MADFCFQCTERLGLQGRDNDFYQDEGEDPNQSVLCEGCGWCVVDHAGRCLHLEHEAASRAERLEAALREIKGESEAFQEYEHAAPDTFQRITALARAALAEPVTP